MQNTRLVFILALVLLIASACSATPPPLQGTDLGSTPAPDFSLTTPDGQAITLSGLRPHVVVLTFVYSQCTDVCPLIANKLSRVYDQLGSAAQQVKFVAVSTAPEEDTAASIASFNKKSGMEGKWLYLNGPAAQLPDVWAKYYIDIATPVPFSTTVGHSTRVVLIDGAGDERVNLDSDFDPSALLQDLQILLGQRY